MGQPVATITEGDVRARLARRTWNEEERAYIDYHARRFAFVLGLIGGKLAEAGASDSRPAEVLDVGPHMITHLLKATFGSSVRVNTMGWANHRLYDPSDVERHFQFDLNDAAEPSRWPTSQEHDLVLMAEVIEHLYTAPEQVLAFIRTFVRPGGYLVIQTPNAVSLRNRAQILFGRNPYDMIRTTTDNPGHFREYTRRELTMLGQRAGFEVDASYLNEYFRINPIVRLASSINPGLRKGLTVVFRRPRD